MADVSIAGSGTITVGGAAGLAVGLPLAASGTISLSGSAWLSVRAHGQDTMAARGRISLRPQWTRLNTGEVLPATDGDGWTAPSVTPPDIREDA